MDQIFVKPGIVDGLRASVRHPIDRLRPVPVEGCFLPNDTFTRKRIREGGLFVCDPPAEGSAPAPVVIEPPAPALAVRRARSGDRPADGNGE